MPTVPYVKQSWTDNVTSATAARFLTLENGIYEAHLMPFVRVTHNAAQSIPNNAQTAMAFNQFRWDQSAGGSDTMHDDVTNNSRLTCRHAGVYMINGAGLFATNSTGIRQLSIRVNGTLYIAIDARDANASGGTNIVVSTQYPLAVNDYVELVAFQDSGGALNVSAAANYTPEFMMTRIA